MSRILLPFIALMVALCALMIGGSIVLGVALPPEPVAVFLTGLPDSELLISQVDVRFKVIFNRRVANIVNFPYHIDARCHVLFPVRVGDELQLAALDLTTGTQANYFPGHYNVNNAEWLPDNRHLWVTYNTYSAAVQYYTIVDTATDTAIQVHLPGEDTHLPVMLKGSPRGDYGVLSGFHSTSSHSYAQGATARFAYLLDIATGTWTELAYNNASTFFWSPDGRYLAYLDSSQRVVLLDTATMALQTREFARVQYALGIDWTPDNQIQFFARLSDDAPFQAFRWRTADGTQATFPVLLDGDRLSNDISPGRAWSPDGNWLFYQDTGNNIHVLSTTTGAELPVNAPRNRFLNHFWSPDSRYLVSYDDNPPTFAFMNLTTYQTTFLNLSTGVTTLQDFAQAWANAPEPGLFISKAATLGRLVFHDGVPAFQPEFQLPKAYLAALCEPERTT